MSSSSDTRPTGGLWASDAEVTGVLPTPELRGGTWTRLGDHAVLGDEITEKVLSRLAQSTVEAARSQGYAVGWAQGRRDAATEAAVEAAETAARTEAAEAGRAAEHARTLAALEQAVVGLDATVGELATALEDQALRLARELTTVLLGRELALAGDAAGDAVRRALDVLPAGTVPVTVRLHPEVRAAAASEQLTARGVVVVADDTLDVHDAVVETDTTYVDRSLDAALARVLEALS
jgi:flagellar assembly protein FliH